MPNTTAPKLHIAFASAEAAPFVKTGGLGDVAGSLPQALKAEGAEVVVFVPNYDTIAQEHKDRMEHICDFYVPLGWRNEYCGIERLSHKGVDYLFVDNEHYFSRGYPYGFFDDGERFAFFSKAVVEALQHLPAVLDGFTCDVLHCNDWHTAMAPVFLREFYQGMSLYQNIKTVFSIHNIAFQGQFSAKVLNDILGLAHIPAAAFQLTCGPDAVNYMQGALNYTDSITTVSPTYAEEIKTAEYGEHLDGILRRRAPILQGIVNGIDTDGFDPATDQRIAQNFTVEDRAGKAVCKARLQEELGLEVRDDRPLVVMVTRLTRQKGMDLVTYSLDRILSGGVQVAVLGTGDTEYENALRYFEGKYPGTMAARIQFDPALSQRMYAGADLFLMPSLFEPCGLSQMIAMRYGTLPIVRETGGLKDTVAPYNQYTGEGTGFSFTHFNGDEMGDAVFRAARLFWDDREAFDNLVEHAMNADFSWKRSAETYMALYHNLHPEIPLPQPEQAAQHETLQGKDETGKTQDVQAETSNEEQKADDESAAEHQPVEPVKKPAARKTTARKANPSTSTEGKEKAGTTKTKTSKTATSANAEPKAAKTAAKAVKTRASKKTVASDAKAAATVSPTEDEPATPKAKKAPSAKTTSAGTKAKKTEAADPKTAAKTATATATKAKAVKSTTRTAKTTAGQTEKPEVKATATAEPMSKAVAKAPAKKTAAATKPAQPALDLDAVLPKVETTPEPETAKAASATKAGSASADSYTPAHAKPKATSAAKIVPKVTRKGKRK